MIASLAMYDRPETRAHYAALWDSIRAAYPGPSPETLTYGGDPWAQWTAPDLVLSHTCGLPYRARLADQVTLVGTPDYGVDGCHPGYYRSVAVMRLEESLPDDFGALRLAYNEGLSQSGWAAAMEFAGGLRFGGYLCTGAHAASAQAVAEGRADIAFLDAVTWRMITRWDGVAAKLHVVATTTPRPGLPLITRAGDAAALARATQSAIAAMTDAARAETGLIGLAQIPRAAYLDMPLPPKPLK
ncbi:MAG: PhnD/SsuA/transferrin family substrate-binding protein [Pseudomonadota bacterium]